MKETYDDLGVTVIYERGAAHVDFKAYEIVGHEAGPLGVYDVPLYSNGDNELDKDVTKAENYVRGTVKWDGCSHVYFGDANNSGYIHMCGSSAFVALARVLKKIYRRCYEIGEFNYDKLEEAV